MLFSIRNKIIAYVAIPVVSICIGAVAWSLLYIKKQTQTEFRVSLVQSVGEYAARFEDYIGKSAVVASVTATTLDAMERPTEAELYDILRANVVTNPSIYGAAFAFEPGMFYPNVRLFSPYVFENEDGIHQMNIDTYDWYTDPQWQWWNRVKSAGYGLWTDPYFDDGVGDVLMITYSTPIRRAGEFWGVTTIDISLTGLREVIAEEFHDDREFVILSPDGYYVYAPDADNIMSLTIQEQMIANGREDLVPFAERILRTLSGTEVIDNFLGEGRLFAAYANIPSTGWTLVTYVDESEIEAVYHEKIIWVVAPFAVTLLLIFASIILVARKLSEPVRTLRDQARQIASGGEITERIDIHSQDEIGELAHAFSTMRQTISDREARLENLREESLRQLLESSPEGIVVVDARGIVCRCNTTAALLFGYQVGSELLEGDGSTLPNLFTDETVESTAPSLQEMIRNPDTLPPSTAVQTTGIRRNGSLFPVSVLLGPLQDMDEVRVVISFRDVTEITNAREALVAQANDLREQKEDLSNTLNQLRKAQSKLVQSEKMASLGVLTAGIAHEINNPINFVTVGVKSMLRDFRDVKEVVEAMIRLESAENPKQAIQALENIRKDCSFDEAFAAIEETLNDIDLGSSRIAEIVLGLSKFSRMGTDVWEKSNIHADLDSVLILLKNKYKRNLAIEKHYVENLPKIDCFPGKLNQAFMNFVSNAIDAIDEKGGGGTIVISSSFDEDSVTISIKDNGVGMSEEVRSKLHDPFFTTKPPGKGVGLGMAITYSILEDHDATLTLNTEKGVGTEFVIKLPIRKKSERDGNKLVASGA